MNLLDQTFQLRGPSALVFGRGRADEIGDQVRAFGNSALLVTDPGIREAGILPVGFDRVAVVPLRRGGP